jgi:hypothetical protein
MYGFKKNLDVVGYAYNPLFLGSEVRITSLRPAGQKLVRLYLRKSGVGRKTGDIVQVAQCLSPWVQSIVLKKRKKEKKRKNEMVISFTSQTLELSAKASSMLRIQFKDNKINSAIRCQACDIMHTALSRVHEGRKQNELQSLGKLKQQQLSDRVQLPKKTHRS